MFWSIALLVVASSLVVVSINTRSGKYMNRVVSACSFLAFTALIGIVVGGSIANSEHIFIAMLVCLLSALLWFFVDRHMSKMDYAEYVDTVGEHMDMEVQFLGSTKIMETGSDWSSVFTLWKSIQGVMMFSYMVFLSLIIRFNFSPINTVVALTLGALVVMSVYLLITYTTRSEKVYELFFRLNPDLKDV